MILRLWRAQIRPGRDAAFLDRLREISGPFQAAPEPLDFTFGFRHEGGRTTFVGVSTWSSFDAIDTVGGPGAQAGGGDSRLEELADTVDAETFERLPPLAERLADDDGRVLGVVTATILGGHESIAQSMIDRSADAAIRAGALAAHIGRRLDGERATVAIVVVWPKRDTMTRFVRSRDIPALDPAFTAHLTSWRFETFDVVSPERLMVPAEGLAVLILDAVGRYLEATPGVEAVLGIPGELLHGRSILELSPDDEGQADLRRRFLETGVSHGTIDVLRPDGRTVRLRYRSVADVPAPGLRAAVLSRPNEPDDPRPTSVIVAEALGLEPVAMPSGPSVAEAGA
jgi:PAS domain-containing protein